jgi:aryl-alcohol dehydrogenase-like predicted oxidoreductase
MAKLRFQGKILLRAVAVRSAEDGIWLIQQGLVDVLQVTYNLLEREAAASGLLALAEAEGIGILGRMPMAQGILSGKFKPGDTVPPGHRAHLAGPLLAERIQKAEIYRALGERYPGGMVRMALHFALTPPGMSAIISGARHQAQLEGNITASNGRSLDEFWQKQLEGL